MYGAGEIRLFVAVRMLCRMTTTLGVATLFLSSHDEIIRGSCGCTAQCDRSLAPSNRTPIKQPTVVRVLPDYRERHAPERVSDRKIRIRRAWRCSRCLPRIHIHVGVRVAHRGPEIHVAVQYERETLRVPRQVQRFARIAKTIRLRSLGSG